MSTTTKTKTTTAIKTTTITTTTRSPSYSEKAVLVLSSRISENVPIIISFDGDINEDFHFKYNEGTSSAYSCGATYEDKFWIFGGSGKSKRQV